MELILFALAFLLGAFAVQLVLLRLTRKGWKWLRFVPLAAVAWFWLLAWNESQDTSMFGGLSDLAALGHAIAGGLILLGWGAAWGIYKLRK